MIQNALNEMGFENRESVPDRKHEENTFIVSNGKQVPLLEPAEEGDHLVTCPFDPALITEAESIEEAFEMASMPSRCLRPRELKRIRRKGYNARAD